MDTLPLLLVLSSAFLHASWNLVVKSSGDTLIAAWSQTAFAALVMSPLVFFDFPSLSALPFVAISSAVHSAYLLSLVAAYERGELSLVYPVARGVAPVIVTAVAALVLDDIPSVGGLVAILFVVIGILWLARGTDTRGIGFALLTGATIAAYTLIDGATVRTLDSAVGYTGAVFLGNAMLLGPIVIRRRGLTAVKATLQRDARLHLFAGAASAGAYVLVLAAARLAPLGLVSAFRETSVVFGALAGWLILHEPDAKRRLRGTFLVAAGLAVLVLVA